MTAEPGRCEIDQVAHAHHLGGGAAERAESDRIRDQLAAMGIAIKDNKDGTTSWEVKR